VTRTPGRLHHIAFVDQREDVLRAADIFLEHGIVIESARTNTRSSRRPSSTPGSPGKPIEVCSGGYLIRARPRAGRLVANGARKGPSVGMQTVASFHIKVPPVPEEDALLAGR
jgi:catechol 2,3-dioxygenase